MISSTQSSIVCPFVFKFFYIFLIIKKFIFYLNKYKLRQRLRALFAMSVQMLSKKKSLTSNIDVLKQNSQFLN